MLNVIVYFLVPVLVILIGAYFYLEVQRRKIARESKKVIFSRVTKIKNNFKADLNHLVELQVLTLSEQEKVYRIANNFFVFQPLTNKNLDYCEKLLNYISSAMFGAHSRIDLSFAQEQVGLFVRALPVAANAYNFAFYSRGLPKLTKRLVDAQENRYKLGSEGGYSELQQ